MNNRVSVTVVERASDLPGKLPSGPLPQPSMRDDVIQQLTSVDEFKDHIVVIWVTDDISHSTNVWVVKKERDGGFTDGTYLLGFILLSLFLCFCRCRGCFSSCMFSVARNDLDCTLAISFALVRFSSPFP